MDNFDTLEKTEKYVKEANCYGEYNYCFIVEKEDTITDAILMCFGAIGGAISGAKKAKGITSYILNKNEKGIGIIPIEKNGKEQCVATSKALFLKNEDIDKVKIKYDTIGKLIKIKMKDKTKYGFKTFIKIKNIPYHEENLKKFMEYYK